MARLTTSAADFMPERRSISALRAAARECQGCDLHQRATQTVFGEGPSSARIILVGEVPGDQEDREGHPFVGPAGRVLDRAVEEAGIDRREVYVTNAVKHFKWEPRGKRRLHKRPNAAEIEACKPWLLAEIDALHARCVVALGATAIQSLLIGRVTIARGRGRLLESPHTRAGVVVSYHPSAALRAPTHEQRQALFEMLVEDLRVAARARRCSAHGQARRA